MYLHRPDSDPPRMTSQFTLRVAIFTGLVIAVFSVIFLRLWYLEVLSGDHYEQLARDNRVREIRVQPPRGDILDRNGKVLVDNRTDLAIQLTPQDLPKRGPERKALIARIGDVAGMTPAQVNRKIKEQKIQLPNSPVIVKQGLGAQKVFYLRENRRLFPGVSVERVFVRDYRQGTLAAHMFGNVGEVTAEQLKEPRYQTLQQGDIVGQSGIEYEYDRFLRGRAGTQRLQFDALGRPRGQLSSTPARAGDNVRLTIDSDLQGVGEAALDSFGLPGAFVAMDVHTGEVLAMGSNPTFDPSIFTKALTPRQYRALTSERTDAPLANRAIQGLYPTGSTFKAITATAALEDGLITPSEIVDDTGSLKVGTTTFRNAGDAVNGPIDMSDAFKVSSDVYFYKLGLEAPTHKGHGAIQDWAHKLGIGERTGIDLPAEQVGLVPTPAWRNRQYREKTNPFIDRPWTVGDNINLAVGQGDLETNPLQMAVAYAAIANGGTVLRPHLAERIESVTGEVLQEIRPAPRRHVDISKTTRSTILEGMHRAAQEDGGTSFEVFGNFPMPIAGKTGTAQRGVLPDQSWYMALAPYPNPKIVVAATVERGGFGVDSAAPVAARILESYFKLKQAPPAAAGGGSNLE